MRTTTNAARGKPLAVALLFLLLVCASGVVWGEGSLQVEQSLSPAEINVAGVGTKPDTATVSMSLLGQGGIERYPLDCVVVIDTSASARLGEAKAFAFDLIGRLASEDRVGVVAFGTTAELVVPLTPDKLEAKLAVGILKEDSKSALGTALQVAREELQRYGREDAVLAIILIADGQNNAGAAPTIEGMVAGETGIRIVTVGLAPIINRTLLVGLAEQSGGVFVQSLSGEAVEEIAEHLAVTASATDVTITKRVPAGLRYISATPTAAQTRTERDGSTTVTWRIAEVGLGQIVRIDAKFDAPARGSLPTDDLSKVTYRDFRGVMRRSGAVAARALRHHAESRTCCGVRVRTERTDRDRAGYLPGPVTRHRRRRPDPRVAVELRRWDDERRRATRASIRRGRHVHRIASGVRRARRGVRRNDAHRRDRERAAGSELRVA